MDVVYATANAAVALEDGSTHMVRGGTHWHADDPVVKAQPSMFSADPRYGLSYSSAPPELFIPPDEPIPERSGDIAETATATPGETRSVRRPKN